MSIFSSIFSDKVSSPAAVRKPAYQHISQAEASEIMASGAHYTVLDVRRPLEYAAGHIPGALNIPNESIGSAEIPQLPDKEALILVHCLSGVRSRQAASKLAALGYINVKDFGGINTWQGEIVI